MFSDKTKVRIKSSIIIALVTLLPLLADPWSFGLFMAFVSGIAVWEWVSMVEPKGKAILIKGASVLAALCAISAMTGDTPISLLPIVLACGFILACLTLVGKGKHPIRVGAGFVYILYALSCLIWARSEGDAGIYVIIMLLAMIWGSDSLAYCLGKLWGGPKMAPKISPNKTWAGLAGACLGGALFAGLMVQPSVLDFFSIPRAPYSELTMVLFGLFFGILAQAGDLMISQVKRAYKLKDTGDLIPGHGGILDRVDGLLFATPFYVAFLWIA